MLDLFVGLFFDLNIVHDRKYFLSFFPMTLSVYYALNPLVLFLSTLKDLLKTLHQRHEDWLIHRKYPCPADVLVSPYFSDMC